MSVTGWMRGGQGRSSKLRASAPKTIWLRSVAAEGGAVLRHFLVGWSGRPNFSQQHVDVVSRGEHVGWPDVARLRFPLAMAGTDRSITAPGQAPERICDGRPGLQA